MNVLTICVVMVRVQYGQCWLMLAQVDGRQLTGVDAAGSAKGGV